MLTVNDLGYSSLVNSDDKISEITDDNQLILLITSQIIIHTDMGDIGFTEILLILLVVVLLFGGRKIPELMKGIGQGMKEFKKASRLDDDEVKKEENKEGIEEKKK
jgi:sec-independent protein translocase protein TatA